MYIDISQGTAELNQTQYSYEIYTAVPLYGIDTAVNIDLSRATVTGPRTTVPSHITARLNVPPPVGHMSTPITSTSSYSEDTT